MTATLGALAGFIKNDLENTNPGRAWRVLHINRAIVATRTLDPTLMSQAFDALVATLPADAARFFGEGMEQMDKLDYPEHVRDVMKSYYDTWSRRLMH